jgi:hypothetical protein
MREVPGSGLGRDTSYTDQAFWWPSSVPSRQMLEGIFNCLTNASFHIFRIRYLLFCRANVYIFASLLIYSPIHKQTYVKILKFNFFFHITRGSNLQVPRMFLLKTAALPSMNAVPKKPLFYAPMCCCTSAMLGDSSHVGFKILTQVCM